MKKRIFTTDLLIVSSLNSKQKSKKMKRKVEFKCDCKDCRAILFPKTAKIPKGNKNSKVNVERYFLQNHIQVVGWDLD